MWYKTGNMAISHDAAIYNMSTWTSPVGREIVEASPFDRLYQIQEYIDTIPDIEDQRHECDLRLLEFEDVAAVLKDAPFILESTAVSSVAFGQGADFSTHPNYPLTVKAKFTDFTRSEIGSTNRVTVCLWLSDAAIFQGESVIFGPQDAEVRQAVDKATSLRFIYPAGTLGYEIPST